MITSSSTLQITPIKKDNAWTSGKIESQRDDFVCADGKKLYVEASIKLGTGAASTQKGIWPAFWALGSELRRNQGNWPSVSEWDFLEAINGGNTMYSTAHCGTEQGGPCHEKNGLGNGGVSFSRGVFHTVGFEIDRTSNYWPTESLNWYLDGSKVYTLTGGKVNDVTAWAHLAHKAHYILLNVAVGGSWPGQPNSETASGTASGMEVGYVGVWNSE